MSKLIVAKDEGAITQNIPSTYVPGKPFQKLGRELGAEDLSNPAVHKLLLNEIDKLESQVSELKDFHEKYHNIDKENAVLESKPVPPSRGA